MCLKKFLSEHDADHSNSLIDVKILEAAEKAVGVKFGEELTEYLLKYGYLAYEYVELYGMNARQGLESDMVKQTLYLHKYFPGTVGLVAIENQGDGDYALVNSKDEVFLYDSSQKTLKKTNDMLENYILTRFESVNPQ